MTSWEAKESKDGAIKEEEDLQKQKRWKGLQVRCSEQLKLISLKLPWENNLKSQLCEICLIPITKV